MLDDLSFGGWCLRLFRTLASAFAAPLTIWANFMLAVPIIAGMVQPGTVVESQAVAGFLLLCWLVFASWAGLGLAIWIWKHGPR